MDSITRNMIVSSREGGELYVCDADGEVVDTFRVEPGRHRASYWFDLIADGESLIPGKGVTCFPPAPLRSGYTVIEAPDRYATDANPDFQPLGQAEKLVLEMRRSLARMSAQNRANEARAAAARSLERIRPPPLRLSLMRGKALSSRRYVKRVWRVPQHRGPVEYLGTAMVKALRKHGWPAELKLSQYDEWSFRIDHKFAGEELPEDFRAAVEIVARIIARTYRVDITEGGGYVTFNRPYIVAQGGHFKEVKP